MAFKDIASRLLRFPFQLSIFKKFWLNSARLLLYSNRGSGSTIGAQFGELLKSFRLHVVEGSEDFDITLVDSSHIGSNQTSNLLAVLRGAIAELMLGLDAVETSSATAVEMEFFALKKHIPEISSSNNHYLFLHALTRSLSARRIVEIGTASGTSLATFLSADKEIFVDTFDIRALDVNMGWLSQSSASKMTALLQHQSNRWTQHVCDLTEPLIWQKYLNLFVSADLVLVDTAHKGGFEKLIYQRLLEIKCSQKVVVWDDIRLGPMLEFWSEIKVPKIDVGGLGHYSGTGLTLMGLADLN